MVNKSSDEFIEKAFAQLEQITGGSRRSQFDRRLAGDYDQDFQTSQQGSKPMNDLTRQEVDAKLAQNKAEVDARLANFDISVKTGFADIKTGFADMKTEMQKMRGDFEKQSHDSTRWIIGSVFGMISLGVAIIGVMINLNKGEKPAPAAAQPATIVVTVPGATVAPAQAPAAK
jgi:hypothetical protein